MFALFASWGILLRWLPTISYSSYFERKDNGSQILIPYFRFSFPSQCFTDFPFKSIKLGTSYEQDILFYANVFWIHSEYVHTDMYNQSQRLKRVTIANCLEKQSYKSSYVDKLLEPRDSRQLEIAIFLISIGASSHQEDGCLAAVKKRINCAEHSNILSLFFQQLYSSRIVEIHELELYCTMEQCLRFRRLRYEYYW